MKMRDNLLQNLQVLRQNWLLLAVILLTATLWMERSPVWAADGNVELHQTIPPLPPTPTPTEVASPTPRPPTPTPTPRPNTGNQGKQDDPTAPPVQTGEPPASSEASQDAVASLLTASVTVPVLNVRQGPGTTFAVIGRLTSGAQVTVLGRNADSTWLYVCCIAGTQTGGWISAQFVTPNFTAAQLDALPVGEGGALTAVIDGAGTITSSALITGVVSVPVLNARAAPSTSAEILGRFNRGAQLTVLGRNAASDWWLVCCAPNGAGNVWVASSFVDSDATVDALPVVTGRGAAVTPALTPTEPSIMLRGPQRLLPAVQGRSVAFLFTVANPGLAAATNAEFSFEMPAGLRFVSASATDGGDIVESQTASGASLVVVTWSELVAGANATVRIIAAVDQALANGLVLAGTAAAIASNAASTFAPVAVGLPPIALPDFR